MTAADQTSSGDQRRAAAALELHRRLATMLHARADDLLQAEQRTSPEDFEMLHAAHAAAWHARQTGGPAEFLRGDLQCADVYATLGWSEPALAHARRALARARQAEGDGRFDEDDLARAYLALARAHLLAGEGVEARLAADHAATAIGRVPDAVARRRLEAAHARAVARMQ